MDFLPGLGIAKPLYRGQRRPASEAFPRRAAGHPEKDGGTRHSQIARLSILRSSATAPVLRSRTTAEDGEDGR